ncbi:MAG: Acetylornithine aminotransferase [Alphaproteobacteria bacterium MarineAlpha9_Bin4]|nr:MAG: Acetylornithine aminotransferase [Alphaproteobacteria bacterium MarineAlpha9_Bin4]
MNNYILPTYNRIKLKFLHGEGSWLYTKYDRYLDFSSGIAVNCLGHSNKKLKKALELQANKLWHTSNLYIISEQEKLAEQLCKLSFANKVFFCNSGAEATDGVIKIMRKYHYANGNKKKNKIIVFNNAFHGRTLTGILAGSNLSHREGFLPNIKSTGGFTRVEFDNIKALDKAIDSNTAGIFLEPIQGEGGINVADINYLKEVRKICNKHNILLALDEVQCGIGRTGKFFAYQWSNIKPDLLTSAKGLGGGFPIGAVLMTNEVAKKMTFGSHGSTFGGNQLACSVALSVIGEITKKNFLKKVIENGNFLRKKLESFKNLYPMVFSSVKGKGLLSGIELKIPTKDFCELARKKKLLLVPAANNVVRLLPPLNVKKNEIKIATSIIEKCLKEIS